MDNSTLATTWAPRLLSILRIMSGLLLLEHGTGKLLHFPTGVVPATFNVMSMPGYAGIIELVCGILLVLGLFTRPAAFIASGMAAVGYFLVHAPMGFFPVLNHGETIALYCFVFLYIFAAGPGPWSIDAARRK
ncbi:putative oxidoreductase [Enhydrobacter aerosaccus]|uniref:Putative oxidoreductase n=1 Tax=Enhydrobacter aerosaccus TaxID=225324 RepID=A0A1T4P5Y8_9HYPH|nr:DoxX family protein [Enhydrobacter aerosaccus]SJZ86348.1 putative oxidoreductase [Enhydrobacter aerosaccus]